MSGGTAGRVVAAGFVGQDNSRAAGELLEKMLSDKDGSVVAASCKALALRGDRASLKVIESLMDDSRDIVEVMGAAAVIRLEVGARANGRTAPKR
jgi:HEAT repeat protein